MTGTALLLTGGILDESNAKTAHGLLRGPSRFRILGVVDRRHAGRDAGEVVDGRVRRIPCFAGLDDALAALPEPPDWLIVGVAFHGGRMPEELRRTILDGVRRGIGAVNGLHQLLADDPEIAAAAAASGAHLHDIRRTPKFAELRFWTGEVLGLAVPRVAVLGTDCALGKRTTATFLLEGLRRRGLRAELVTTGQTGWLQGHRHGFILDATPNDFVTGELERAVVACAREAKPDLILLEGQSALRNPGGPCGAELLLAAGAAGSSRSRRRASRPTACDSSPTSRCAAASSAARQLAGDSPVTSTAGEAQPAPQIPCEWMRTKNRSTSAIVSREMVYGLVSGRCSRQTSTASILMRAPARAAGWNVESDR